MNNAAASYKCFEWNWLMWEGIPRNENPAYTICGLETCIPCDMDKAASNQGTGGNTI